MATHKTKNWLLFIILTLLWGTSFMQITVSLRAFTPEQLVSWRLVLAAVVLVAYMLYRQQRFPLGIRHWLKFALFASIGNILPYWLITTGQQTITSGMAGLLMAVMPLVTMMLAHWFIPDEKLNRYRIVGFVLGISGVLFVLWPNLVSGSNSVYGALIVLLAAVCYAVNTILIRLYSNYEISVVSAGVMVSAALLSMILWPQMWQVSWPNEHMESLIALIWLGIFPTGIASVIYFILVKDAGPTFVSNNNYIIPVIAYIAGAWLLDEQVSSWDLLALAVVLLGIAISRKQLISR